MQDLPNHAAEPMSDGPDGGLIAQPRQQTPEHRLKVAAVLLDRKREPPGSAPVGDIYSEKMTVRREPQQSLCERLYRPGRDKVEQVAAKGHSHEQNEGRHELNQNNSKNTDGAGRQENRAAGCNARALVER
jgi:hypothetical protein